jgi:hypothetical protein
MVHAYVYRISFQACAYITVPRPVGTISFAYSLGGRSSNVTITGASPYNIDYVHQCESPQHARGSETDPLLCRASTNSTCVQNEQREFSQRHSRFFDFSEMPLHNFETDGWVKHTLLDSSIYFHHPRFCVVTDIDLQDLHKLDVVMTILNKLEDEGDLPPEEWELWLRDVEVSEHESFPARAWVHHAARIISFNQSPPGSSEICVPQDKSQFTSVGFYFCH